MFSLVSLSVPNLLQCMQHVQILLLSWLICLGSLLILRGGFFWHFSPILFLGIMHLVLFCFQNESARLLNLLPQRTQPWNPFLTALANCAVPDRINCLLAFTVPKHWLFLIRQFYFLSHIHLKILSQNRNSSSPTPLY